MSNQLIPSHGGLPEGPGTRLPRQVARGLLDARAYTDLRLATLRGEAATSVEKIEELQYMGLVATSGDAMLEGVVNHLAGDNPLLAIRLRAYSDIVQLGVAQIMGDTINRFRKI